MIDDGFAAYTKLLVIDLIIMQERIQLPCCWLAKIDGPSRQQITLLLCQSPRNEGQ